MSPRRLNLTKSQVSIPVVRHPDGVVMKQLFGHGKVAVHDGLEGGRGAGAKKQKFLFRSVGVGGYGRMLYHGAMNRFKTGRTSIA